MNKTAQILPTLIITRPYAQSKQIARQLNEHGIATFNFPLLEIHPVNHLLVQHAFAQITQFALVIFISPSAIEITLPIYRRITTKPWSIPIAVLGRGSIDALKRQGITVADTRIISPVDLMQTFSTKHLSFDSEALLLALEQAGMGPKQLAGKQVLLIRGNGGRELLLQNLQQADVHVTVIEAYQRQCPKPDSKQCSDLIEIVSRPHYWLLTSSEAIHNLQKLRDSLPCLKQLGTALVTHRRIADTAQQVGFKKTQLIDGAQAQDLLSVLLDSHI